MVKITRSPMLLAYNGVLDHIVDVCRTLKSGELCGVVGGKFGSIFSTHFVKNIANSMDVYEMSPVDFDEKLEIIEKEGNELVALFHSHRGDSAQPSRIDIDKAILDVPMIIISQKDVKAWNIKPDKSFEEFNLLMHNTKPTVPGGPIKALGTDGVRFTVEVSGKVFEQLPAILHSYFGGRQGPAFPDRMHDLRDLLSLASMTMRDLRVNDDPDALASRLINDPNANDRLRCLVDNELRQGLVMHGLVPESAFGSTIPSHIPNTVVSGTNPFITSKPKPPEAPPHTHKYRKVSKSPDGHDVFECTFEHCDKTLIIDGDIDIGLSSPEESIKQLAKNIAVGEAVNAIIVEVDKHGKSEEGANPGGQGPDPKA